MHLLNQIRDQIKKLIKWILSFYKKHNAIASAKSFLVDASLAGKMHSFCSIDCERNKLLLFAICSVLNIYYSNNEAIYFHSTKLLGSAHNYTTINFTHLARVVASTVFFISTVTSNHQKFIHCFAIALLYVGLNKLPKAPKHLVIVSCRTGCSLPII